MGIEGLYCFDGEQDPQGQGWIERPAEGVRNYYKVVYLGECEGKEIFGCATRADGLSRIQFDEANTNRILSLAAPSVDLIDATSLRSTECPFAVAGLSLDCSLVLVRDILSLDEQDPRRLRFDGLRGTPYSVLSAQGHILLLTSAELVILPDLASRFLDGDRLDRAVHTYHTPVEAVEAFIASDRYLMVITDEVPILSARAPRVSPSRRRR
jgi:hypothetical protein